MTVRVKENQLRVGDLRPGTVGNHLTLELGNDLALELGNHLTPKMGNHLTLRLGNQLVLRPFRLGNNGGP